MQIASYQLFFDLQAHTGAIDLRLVNGEITQLQGLSSADLAAIAVILGNGPAVFDGRTIHSGPNIVPRSEG